MYREGTGMIRSIIFWGIMVLLVREAVLAGWIDRLIM
jgi:hypothetical protein